MMIEIQLNGDSKQVTEGITVHQLIEDLGLDPTKVAVERNREIVSKSLYQEVEIAANDQLEIVHFIGGG